MKVTLRREKKLYSAQEKELVDGAKLELEVAPREKYLMQRTELEGLNPDRWGMARKEDISYIREQRLYGRMTLVAEIARYLNRSCLEVEQVLEKTAERTGAILAAVNEHNELLFDWVIPRLFGHLYEIEEYTRSDEEEIELVKIPADGYYQVSADPAKAVAEEARARGRLGGRRRSMTPEKVKLASRLMQDPTVSVNEICRTLRVSRATLYRYISPSGELRQST